VIAGLGRASGEPHERRVAVGAVEDRPFLTIDYGPHLSVRFRLGLNDLESSDNGGPWEPVRTNWRNPDDFELNSAIARILRWVEERS
jgi:hypothetical protein